LTEYSSLLVHVWALWRTPVAARPKSPQRPTSARFPARRGPRKRDRPRLAPRPFPPPVPAPLENGRQRANGPDPKSQPFSRGFKSVLPTSLTHIILWTRGCTPWGPDAVMGTIRNGICLERLGALRFSRVDRARSDASRNTKRSSDLPVPHLESS